MNNFDTSSSGLDIELVANYDLDLSRIYFDECFARIGDQLVYGEGQCSDFVKAYTFTVDDLKDAIIGQLCWTNYGISDLKADIKGYTGNSWSKIKKADLVKYMQKDWDSYQWNEFCEKAGFAANFDTVISRGYSQGDYEKVIVPYKLWECIGVKKPECVQSNLVKTINNLLWNSPVYCRFTVNGEEFYIDQELTDVYKWDKDEALQIAGKLIKKEYTEEEQTIILDFLTSALKTNLDYQ
jgi:hypothetical protein